LLPQLDPQEKPHEEPPEQLEPPHDAAPESPSGVLSNQTKRQIESGTAGEEGLST